MKILCITPVHDIEGVMERLKDLGEVVYRPNCSRDEFLNISEGGCDAIFTNPNAQTFVLDRAASININRNKVIVVTASTGTDHIDFDWFCVDKVFSLRNQKCLLEKLPSTAEHAFGLMLALLRNIPSSFDAVKKGLWNYEPFIGRQLRDTSVGIIGMGRLGEMFYDYCLGFGMTALAYDIDPDRVRGATGTTDIDDLFRSCDVISLHAHASKENTHLINDNVLAGCRPFYLINTSRSSLVDEHAVCRALETKRLLGYATDVLSSELGGNDSPILDYVDAYPDCSNVIITPHVGGMTHEGRYKAFHKAVDILRDVLKRPQHD